MIYLIIGPLGRNACSIPVSEQTLHFFILNEFTGNFATMNYFHLPGIK
ncbi:MAG: hypothetical protein Kow0010_14890 [Dehalococcoidia bacterium]